MKLKKTIAYLLTMTLLSTVAFAQVPLTATVNAVGYDPITWLTHWTEPDEKLFWDGVIAAYESQEGRDVTMISVEFDFLYEEIMLRHAPPDWASKTDTDIVHMHTMWVPDFATYATQVLAVPDDTVQNNVRVDWTDPTEVAATYKGIVYGYPTEYNSWALVYDRYIINRELGAHPELQPILNKLEARNPYQPLTWDELKTAARALTKWNLDGSINQTGFIPFLEGMPEEQRFQFLSLLWSNGGDYVDLSVPTTLFNNQSGYDVMQLYYDLGGYGEGEASYDPLNLADYWYGSWTYTPTEQTIAMMILPTWMTFIRGAMGDNFGNLGVAPIPIGPHGWRGSVSATYSWMLGVTEKAKRDGRDDEAWYFLDWLTKSRSAPVTNIPGIGDVPGNAGTSIMGDFLIYDSIVPSRLSDQADPRLNDFWFEGFMNIGAQYGKADKAFWKADEVQAEIGLMFEKVVLTGAVTDPTTAVNDAATAIKPLLPMAGDINLDGPVNILDANLLTYDAFTSLEDTPTEWKDSRGRSDINDDNEVDVFDATILGGNFG